MLNKSEVEDRRCRVWPNERIQRNILRVTSRAREGGEDLGLRERRVWMPFGRLWVFEGGVAGFVQRQLAGRLLTAVPS